MHVSLEREERTGASFLLSRPNQGFAGARGVAVGAQCARNTGRMKLGNDRQESPTGDDLDGRPDVAITSDGPSLAFGAEHPVLDARSLIDQLQLVNAIRVLRIRLAFPPEVFALAVRPLIDAYAEWVQLLPVGTSEFGPARYVQAGGQLQRACVSAIRVLDRRRGQILPRGAAPEVIGELAHRWTYAVFVAALLCDAGRVDAGLRVWISDGAERLRVWRPMEGSMRECGASHYRVEALSAGVLSGDRDPVAPDPVDPAYSALALRLFERRVPAAIREWLDKDQALMAELHACLTGQVDKAGAIGSLLADDARCDVQARSVAVDPAPGAVVTPQVADADVALELGVTAADQTRVSGGRAAGRTRACQQLHALAGSGDRRRKTDREPARWPGACRDRRLAARLTGNLPAVRQAPDHGISCRCECCRTRST